MSLLHWTRTGSQEPEHRRQLVPARLPVVMLHGSPGAATNFDNLGRGLAEAGREAHAPDLPGFGRSDPRPPSYSIRAHAHAVLAALDELGLERVHVMGWSMGGGVGLHLAELAPARVASLTLIASIGVQESEGSGSYAFEHLKYALSWAFLVTGPELLPHFGLLGDGSGSRAFIRNFWDTDQRKLRPLMKQLDTPTLILHGREDFLAPAWGAEIVHELIRPSSLVMLDAGHFLPIGSRQTLDESLGWITPFLDRHDRSGTAVTRRLVDLSRPRSGWWGIEKFTLARVVPWWLQLAVIALAVWFFPWPATLVTGLLIGVAQIDAGLGLIACGITGSVASLTRVTEGRRLARLPWALAASTGWGLIAVSGMVAGGLLFFAADLVVGEVPALLFLAALFAAMPAAGRALRRLAYPRNR